MARPGIVGLGGGASYARRGGAEGDPLLQAWLGKQLN